MEHRSGAEQVVSQVAAPAPEGARGTDARPQARQKSILAFLVGPALFTIALLLPIPEGVPPVGMRSLGIFLWVMSWWIAEPIPLPATSFLGMALLVLCGVFPLETAFSYWANWVNIFLIGAFIIGQAVNLHGLNRRFAYWIVCRKFVGSSSSRLLFSLLSACVLLSAVSSNIVCTVVFISIALGVIKSLEINPRSRYATALLIGVPWAASIGGAATPVGAATQIYAIGLLRELDYRVGFLPWMMFGVPMMLVCTVAMFLVIWLVFRPEFQEVRVSSGFARQGLEEMGPIRRAEKISAAVLLAAWVLWMLPDLTVYVLGQSHPVASWLQSRLSWAVVGLLAALSLFLIPVDWKERKFAMTWGDAVKGVEWGVLALVAGALAIGSAVSDPKVGLGNFFAKGFEFFSASGGSPMLLIPLSIFLVGLLTNFISNFATLSAVLPVMLAIATSPGSGINPVALTLTLGVTSSWAFALPSATPTNAIAFASGHVHTSDMFKGGIVLAMLCTTATAFMAYHLINWIFPWPG